jgi:hypothetical protein
LRRFLLLLLLLSSVAADISVAALSYFSPLLLLSAVGLTTSPSFFSPEGHLPFNPCCALPSVISCGTLSSRLFALFVCEDFFVVSLLVPSLFFFFLTRSIVSPYFAVLSPSIHVHTYTRWFQSPLCFSCSFLVSVSVFFGYSLPLSIREGKKEEINLAVILIIITTTVNPSKKKGCDRVEASPDPHDHQRKKKTKA